MDPAAELGKNPVSKRQIQLSLTRDETAKPVSRDQILRRERGQEIFHYPCLADHERDYQPYPVDPYSCYMCDHTLVWEREAHINWFMLTCQGSTRLKLP